MKKIISCIIFVIIILIAFSSCKDEKMNIEDSINNTSSKNAYDRYGIWIDEVSELLSEYGSVRWDPTEDMYVLNLRNTEESNTLTYVKYLMENPTYDTGLKWWDALGTVFELVTEEYNCSLRVANPYNSNNSLMIITSGEIVYSTF